MSLATKLQGLPHERTASALDTEELFGVEGSLLHSPHAATACSSDQLSRNSAEHGSFPHCLDADTRTGISTSFSTVQLWETGLDHDLHQGTTHDLPQTGTSTSLNEHCNCGISTVFSTRSSTVGWDCLLTTGTLKSSTTCTQGNRPPCRRTATGQTRACRQP